MSFFNEVISLLGIDAQMLAAGYQIVNYNGEAVYVEGYKKVLSIAENEIILELRKGKKISLQGEGLNVFSLEDTTIIVKGKISACVTEG